MITNTVLFELLIGSASAVIEHKCRPLCMSVEITVLMMIRYTLNSTVMC